MSTSVARPYAGAVDLPSLIDFAQRIGAACRPRPAYYHPGDFVWQLALLDASDDVMLWHRSGDVVACAIFEPPITFQFDVDTHAPDMQSLHDAALRWAVARFAQAGGGPSPIAYQSLAGALSTWAFEHDAPRIQVLEEHGFARTGEGGIRYAQPLDATLGHPKLPSGARARGVTAADFEQRVDLHRDAWSVWGTSSFNADQYRRLRAAPLYDSELDVVVEFEGQLVSYCVCWTDRRNGVGYFEPVGTRPAVTGRGFGRAALTEGLRRLRERGMTLARVATASINTGAQALYPSAGFVEEAREFSYSRREPGQENRGDAK